MSTLKENLNFLLKEADMNVSELARQTGVIQSALHRIMTGDTTNPNVNTLRPLAKFFAISLSQLLGDEPLPLDKLQSTHAADMLTAAYLPILTWDDIQPWLDNLIDAKKKPPEWISTEKQVGSKAFSLKIETDSYGLMFKKGSLIILDPDRAPQDGDLILVKLKSEPDILFKQFIKDGNDIYLRPVNTEIHRMKLLDEPYKLLGTFIELRYALQNQPSQKALPKNHPTSYNKPILQRE